MDASALSDDLGTKIVPKAYLPTPATEPQHGWLFSHVLYVYVPAGADGANRLLCRLHYTQDGDADLAGRMGGLLALAHRTLTVRTGQEAANGTSAFDVWLCRQGQTGGEQWRSNIYFYDLAPRAVPSNGSGRSCMSTGIWRCRPSAVTRTRSTGQTATTGSA